MTLSRLRTPLLTLALAACLTLAFAGGAMAATQNIGPYQVTDEVTQAGSGAGATTTATYTITVPNDAPPPFAKVQDLSHASVGVCNDLADRTYVIERLNEDGTVDQTFNGFSPNGDPSINVNTPIVKWDIGQAVGTTYRYAYTVPGHWDAVDTTLYIKSADTFSGTVKGIGCANTPPPEEEEPPPTGEQPPPENTPLPPPLQQQPQPQGEQDVLGDTVEPGTARIAGASGCQRKPFKISVRGRSIRKVTFTIDGKKVRNVRRSGNGGVYSITINPNRYKPGSHVVTAKVSFTAASNTRSKTLRARFARCVRQVAPSFTG